MTCLNQSQTKMGEATHREYVSQRLSAPTLLDLGMRKGGEGRKGSRHYTPPSCCCTSCFYAHLLEGIDQGLFPHCDQRQGKGAAGMGHCALQQHLQGGVKGVQWE